MINLLMIIPNMEDATSLYRGIGPFALLKNRFDYNMTFASKNNGWSVLNMIDVVFMQRPYTREHLEIAQMAKFWGKPVWVDYDDLLFDVPADNPAHRQYMNTETRNTIAQIIRAATVVTTSTTQLKRCFQLKKSSLNDKIYVIENGLMDNLLSKASPFNFKKQVSWRGSNTHMRDLALHAAPMIDVAKRHKDATFTFIGDNPWFITEEMQHKQAVVCEPMAITDYLDFITRANASIQMVPLHPSVFNKCKSNISWIEATLAGSVCIGPNWEEWRKPGMITYQNPDDFESCLDFALSSPDKLKEFHALSWDYIQKNLLLSVLNEKREMILKRLYRMSKGEDVLWPEGGARVEDEEVMELE